MPQHKSAIKRMRTSERRRAYNRMNKSRMKNALKELRSTTDKTAAEEKYRQVSRILDRLATKGIIHRNTAAHKKSKLAKFVHSLG
jgi:small subunit ribosomal protein S20